MFLEVFILKGLQVYFAEVRILKGLAVEEKKLGSEDAPLQMQKLRAEARPLQRHRRERNEGTMGAR